MSEILKSKDIILKEWEINESSSGKKRENPQKFLIINEYPWKWYVLCRQSNVPVSGPMLQAWGEWSGLYCFQRLAKQVEKKVQHQ